VFGLRQPTGDVCQIDAKAVQQQSPPSFVSGLEARLPGNPVTLEAEYIIPLVKRGGMLIVSRKARNHVANFYQQVMQHDGHEWPRFTDRGGFGEDGLKAAVYGSVMELETPSTITNDHASDWLNHHVEPFVHRIGAGPRWLLPVTIAGRRCPNRHGVFEHSGFP